MTFSHLFHLVKLDLIRQTCVFILVLHSEKQLKGKKVAYFLLL